MKKKWFCITLIVITMFMPLVAQSNYYYESQQTLEADYKTAGMYKWFGRVGWIAGIGVTGLGTWLVIENPTYDTAYILGFGVGMAISGIIADVGYSKQQAEIKTKLKDTYGVEVSYEALMFPSYSSATQEVAWNFGAKVSLAL
ncbi:MAG: hypothetical protein R3Y36_06385 [Spirochaetales bacterium]